MKEVLKTAAFLAANVAFGGAGAVTLVRIFPTIGASGTAIGNFIVAGRAGFFMANVVVDAVQKSVSTVNNIILSHLPTTLPNEITPEQFKENSKNINRNGKLPFFCS